MTSDEMLCKMTAPLSTSVRMLSATMFRQFVTQRALQFVPKELAEAVVEMRAQACMTKQLQQVLPTEGTVGFEGIDALPLSQTKEFLIRR